MSPAEFVAASVSFSPGSIYVVSGPDYCMVYDLLMEAQAAIVQANGNALVYNSRTTISNKVFYQDNIAEGLSWEYTSLISDGFVVLVANQFDNLDPRQNPHPIDLAADTVRDVMNAGAVNRGRSEFSSPDNSTNCGGIENVSGFSGFYNMQNKKYGITRDLFSHVSVSRLYFYDTRNGSVVLIRGLLPE